MIPRFTVTGGTEEGSLRASPDLRIQDAGQDADTRTAPAAGLHCVTSESVQWNASAGNQGQNKFLTDSRMKRCTSTWQSVRTDAFQLRERKGVRCASENQGRMQPLSSTTLTHDDRQVSTLLLMLLDMAPAFLSLSFLPLKSWLTRKP